MAITRVAVVLTSTESALIGNCFATAALAANHRSEVRARADSAIKRIHAIEDNVLLFSSGHFLRVFAARWLGFEPGAGRVFLLSTASLSALSYEHNLSQPAIRLWDDDHHVGD
jgi:broad specificity phosphatase PhoE